MVDQPSSRISLGRVASELQESLRKAPESCPVCLYVAGSLRHSVDLLFYENVTDVDVRDTIRQAGAFCRRHARLIARQADALGTALILHDLLNNQLQSFQRYDRPPLTASPISRLFDGGKTEQDRESRCWLCSLERERDELGVDSLLEGLGNPAFAEDFRRSAGVCLPHFRLAFARCDDQDRWEQVQTTERASLERLTGELAELARTFDHRFRGEAESVRSDAWKRALAMVCGWYQDDSASKPG